jgi:hypothetical protein
MANYCYTGTRKLTYGQGCKVEAKLAEITAKHWGEDWHTHHVGDANGVDALVRRYLAGLSYSPTIYCAEGRQPWQLAARSKRMVEECRQLGNAKLIAYPNRPCPAGVKPGKNFNGQGSGTWGTIAYAKHLGLEIEVIWLCEPSEPEWMKQTQLTLL